jgi:hypothetical protein
LPSLVHQKLQLRAVTYPNSPPKSTPALSGGSMLLSLLLAYSFALVSPFPSQVEGLDIPNSHIVEDKTPGYLVRGMRPRTEKDIEQLIDIGITDVLIFKDTNPTDTSTQAEINMLKEQGISSRRIRVIPFKWKEIESFKTACLQTLEALRLMKTVANDKNRNLFFHCTVGEDRTGYLAALYKILFQGRGAETAWKRDMCENGYADGNPRKPAHVVEEIHSNISVLYQKMLYKIKRRELSFLHLENSICDSDPADHRDFRLSRKYDDCEPSVNYDPDTE